MIVATIEMEGELADKVRREFYVVLGLGLGEERRATEALTELVDEDRRVPAEDGEGQARERRFLDRLRSERNLETWEDGASGRGNTFLERQLLTVGHLCSW